MLAGDQAVAVYAHAEAEQHYRSAIGLAAELGDRAHEAQALAKLTRMYGIATHYEEAIAAGERAVRLWQTLGDREGVAAATLELVRAHYGGGRFEEGERHVVSLIWFLTAEEPPDPPERSLTELLASPRAERAAAGLSPDTATFLCTARAVILDRQGHTDDALAPIEQAIVHAQRARDAQLICQAHMIHSNMLWNLGRVQAALDAYQHTARLAWTVGDLWILTSTLTNAAIGCAMLGEMAQAERICAEALAAGERTGAPDTMAGARCAMAELVYITGEWPHARAHLERAHDLAAALGSSQVATMPLAEWGRLWLAEGERGRGMDALEEVVACGAARANPWSLLIAEQALAELDLLDGEPARARARLEPYHSFSSFSSAPDAQLVWLLPWALLEVGEVERAADLIEPVVADARARHAGARGGRVAHPGAGAAAAGPARGRRGGAR
jgi:tetratricopeptide (TPR) repeat protein